MDIVNNLEKLALWIQTYVEKKKSLLNTKKIWNNIYALGTVGDFTYIISFILQTIFWRKGGCESQAAYTRSHSW